MATDSESGNGSDPFSDHAAILDGDSERDAIAESTLRVGRNAALTLGTVAVIVLGACHLESGLRQRLTGVKMKEPKGGRD